MHKLGIQERWKDHAIVGSARSDWMEGKARTYDRDHHQSH